MSITYPAAASVPNAMTDFGATGNGTTDDTAAIQAGISAALRLGKTVLYLPAGTYLVSGTLDWVDGSGLFQAFCLLQGAGAGLTTIKLADNCSGFTNAASPKAIIRTDSLYDGQLTGADGRGNDAFANYVQGLTIDAGTGNAGAIGVDYLGNNFSALRDLAFAGTGFYACVSMVREYPGPCLLKNLTFGGTHQYGLVIDQQQYSATAEYLTDTGATVAAISNTGLNLAVKGLTTSGLSCPSVVNAGGSVLTLLDSTLGGSGGSAITSDSASILFASNLTTSGYTHAIVDNDATIAGGSGISHSSRPVAPLGSAYAPTLTWVDTPQPPADDPSTWAIVAWDSSGDQTAKIQAAIDSGATTVCFQSVASGSNPTNYGVSATIHVRGNVRRILGLNQSIAALGPAFTGSGPATTVFSIESASSVTFEKLALGSSFVNYNRARWFGHQSAGDLVVKDVTAWAYAAALYQPTSAPVGRLFLENVSALRMPLITAPGQSAYARQWNPESDHRKNVNCGNMLVLGYKSELSGREIINRPGAVAEFYGMFCYPISEQTSLDDPMIDAMPGSSAYLAGVTLFGAAGTIYQSFAREDPVISAPADVPLSLGVAAGGGVAIGSYGSTVAPLPATTTKFVVINRTGD